MQHNRRRHHLGRKFGPRRALLDNLTMELFRHERIRTTEAKAKALRPYAEPLITMAKEDTLHHRRLVMRKIQDKEILRKLFESIAPRNMERPGGYLRIIKAAPRPGDNAPMAVIELVERVVDAPKASESEAPATAAKKPGFLSRMLGRK